MHVCTRICREFLHGPCTGKRKWNRFATPARERLLRSELSKSIAAESAFVGLIMWSHAAACPEEMCYRGWCTHTASSQIADHFALTLCNARVSRELPSFLSTA